MKPSLTSINRTAVREPSAVRRQGMNARKQADQKRDVRRQSIRRSSSALSRFVRSWGLAIALVAALAVGSVVLYQQALAKGWIGLQRVRCTGLRLLKPDQVARMGRLWSGTPLTAISSGATQTLLLLDPRVTKVTVRRVWPHEVRIDIEEEVPQVRDGRGHGFGISGRDLGQIPSALELPLLDGKVVPGQDLSKLLTGLERLRREDSTLWKQLRSLESVPDGMVAHVISLPVELLLPADAPAEALRRAAWLHGQLGESAAKIALMDLRHAPYAVLVPTGRIGS